MRISVKHSAALQGTILALRGMDKELSKQIRQHTKTVTDVEWKAALAARATSKLERAVLVDSGRVAISSQNITLTSGALANRISKTAKTNELTHSAEFGADREHVETLESKTGKTYKRHTRRQFKPRNLKGAVVYPAAAEVIPRIAALWAQTTVRTFHELLEKGAN